MKNKRKAQSTGTKKTTLSIEGKVTGDLKKGI